MSICSLSFDILKHTNGFSRYFVCTGVADNYAHFVAHTRTDYACVNVYRTSERCFRVIWYRSHLQTERLSKYRSFRSLTELCSYLDALSTMLV